MPEELNKRKNLLQFDLGQRRSETKRKAEVLTLREGREPKKGKGRIKSPLKILPGFRKEKKKKGKTNRPISRQTTFKKRDPRASPGGGKTLCKYWSEGVPEGSRGAKNASCPKKNQKQTEGIIKIYIGIKRFVLKGKGGDKHQGLIEMGKKKVEKKDKGQEGDSRFKWPDGVSLKALLGNRKKFSLYIWRNRSRDRSRSLGRFEKRATSSTELEK